MIRALTAASGHARRLQVVGADLAGVMREVVQGHREAARHVPKPPAGGLVLEVGAGQSAHPRTDVVVDKYIADDFERPGQTQIDLSKPLIVADGERLPLVDRSFAYVIALHVLEHANDPRAFAAELTRVAPAGFVQVPTREAELTFGWPYHPWLIDRDGARLVFVPRDGQKAPAGELFHRAYDQSPALRWWWAAHRSLWHHSLEWREQLVVEVLGSSSAEATASFDLKRTVQTLRHLGATTALSPLPPEVRAALRCPVDSGDLQLGSEHATCRVCDRVYPVVGEVPVLLDAAAS